MVAINVAVMDGMRVDRLGGLGMDGGRSSVLSAWKMTCIALSALAEASVGMTMSSLSDLLLSDGLLWGSRTLMFSGSLEGSLSPSIGPQSDRGINRSSLVISSGPWAICHAKYLRSLMCTFTHARNSKLNSTA